MGDVALIDWRVLEGVTLAFLIKQIFNGDKSYKFIKETWQITRNFMNSIVLKIQNTNSTSETILEVQISVI